MTVDARRHPVLLASLALSVPLTVALVAARRPTWYPTGDLAQAELHVRAVPAHMPLLGAAGRFGTIFEQGSHLGPAGAISLAIPYRLAGSSGWALLAATIMVHLAAIIGSLVVCRRVGGISAMAVLTVLVALMVRSFGADWFLEPWNPWLGVFALLFAVVCAWAVWDERYGWLLGVVLAGSYCAQVHVAYMPVVVVLGAAVVARLIVLARRGHGPNRAQLGTAIAALVVVWIPPVVDQLTRDPGNLTVLWRHFLAPPDDPAGWRATLSTFVNEVNLFGSWSSGVIGHPSTSPDVVSWVGFVALAALAVVATVVARRRDDRVATYLWHVTWVLVGASLLTVTRIYGPVYDYLVRWLATVAVVVVLASTWTLWRAVAGRIPPAAVGALALAVATLTLGTATFATHEQPLARDSATLSRLAPDLIAATDDDTRYLVRFHDPVVLGAIGIGALLDMERHGRSVGADRWLRANVLPQRTMDETDADQIVWVVTGDPAIDRTAALPGAQVVAETDPRTPDEAARSDQLRADIESRLVAAGRPDLVARLDEQYGVSQVVAEPGLDPALVAALEAYRALRLPVAVVLVPITEEPA